MKALFALVHREYIEHRGAFFIAPLVLVGVVFALTLLAFSVDRLDTRFSGQLLTVVPTWVFEAGFAGLSGAWLAYLGFVLFFYCADGFAADKRNNAMLFWKSMPVTDFKVLLSKITAALTILPGAVFAVALISILLMFGVADVTTMVAGLGNAAIALRHLLPNIMSPLIVKGTIQLSLGILAEAGLSYIGLGTQPPATSLGLMLRDAQSLFLIHPWLSVMPGLTIVLIVIALNVAGDGLRDAMDPRLRHEGLSHGAG